MRRLLFGVVVLVALAASLVAMPDAAHATGPPVTCGSTITTDTVLTEDVTCVGHTLSVSEGATLDLGGHTVTSTGTSFSCTGGLFDPHPNGSNCTISAEGTVRNGTIAGAGIYSSGLFDHVKVRGGGVAIASGIVRSSSLTDTSVVGIQGVTLENNLLIRSGVSLNNVNFGLGVDVHENLIFDSPGDAISVGVFFFPYPDDISGSITGNLVAHSGGVGITSQAVAAGFADFAPFEVARNIVWGSKGDGIDWRGEETNPVIPSSLSGPMSVHHNLVVANGGHGIVTGPITVGNTKGNIALFNKTSPQCIGVTCGPFFRFGFPGL